VICGLAHEDYQNFSKIVMIKEINHLTVAVSGKNANHGWRNLFQSGGGVQAHVKKRQKIYRKFLWFESATVTSQALKYDVITYTPYEGLNYSILNKITPL